MDEFSFCSNWISVKEFIDTWSKLKIKKISSKQQSRTKQWNVNFLLNCLLRDSFNNKYTINDIRFLLNCEIRLHTF